MGNQQFSLRPYQIDCAAKTIRDLANHKSLLIVMPTGAGKTECFIEITNQWLAANPGRSVFILSHLSLLINQTMKRFQKRSKDASVGILQAGVYPSAMDKIVLSTVQTASSRQHLNKCLNKMLYKPGLIIVDETHRLLSKSYEHLIGCLPECKLVGVTATPFKQNQHIANHFERISYSISLQELIVGGYLVTPKLFQIKRESFQLHDVMAEIMAIYQENEMGKSSIIFMRKVEDAKLLKSAFLSANISSEVVTGDITGHEREAIFASYDSGATKVLISVDVLSAGFDSSRVESIFMPYGTKSVVQYVQRIGRGLRLCPEIGKAECRIYVFGSQPSIARKLYHKVHAQALNGDTFKEYATIVEDYDYNNQTSGEKYIWTAAVLNAINKLKKLRLSGIADLLNEKKFPSKFMERIEEHLSNLPEYKVAGSSEPISKAQEKYLTGNGFKAVDLQSISKKEASLLIGLLLGDAPHKTDEKFIIKSGSNKGKHISHVSQFYLNYVTTKFPNSGVAKLYREYLKQKGNV